MKIQVTEQSDRNHITLTGSLTIAFAEQARIALISAITTHENCDIDLSAVDAIDTAGLQLLLMIRKSAKKARFIQPSSVIQKFLSLAFPECALDPVSNVTRMEG